MDRQKVLIIFGGAWLSAALLTWFLYAKTKAPQSEKTIRVVAASRDLQAGSRLKSGDLKFVRVSERDAPKAYIDDDKIAVNRVLLYPVSANETLMSNRLTSHSTVEGLAATIEPGKRAISVPITDSSGVAGLVQPRSRVDVLFTKPGAMADAISTVLLEDIVVMSIGKLTEAGQTVDPRAPKPQIQTATLLVTPEDARKLELAKNQGKLSLALRNPLDRSTIADNAAVGAEVLDPMAGTRVRRPKPGMAAAVRDPKAWARLTNGEEAKPAKPPEPPKPRFVVDVYRGDKHVQEIFQ